MAHGVVCHFDLPHMAQKVADWTRREGRPRADEMAHGAVCRFELPHVAENNRRVTRVDSSLWPQRTVPKLPSGTNGCQTLKTATLNTFYFCQKRPLCQPPPSPTPPPNSHFVRKVKLRLAYRLAFVIRLRSGTQEFPFFQQTAVRSRPSLMGEIPWTSQYQEPTPQGVWHSNVSLKIPIHTSDSKKKTPVVWHLSSKNAHLCGWTTHLKNITWENWFVSPGFGMKKNER